MLEKMLRTNIARPYKKLIDAEKECIKIYYHRFHKRQSIKMERASPKN